jgi:hypothetical protein
MIRDYTEADFDQIKKIHEQNKLGFTFPNLNSQVFAINKVLEVEGTVRASYALRLMAEVNLWMSQEKWTDAAGKWEAIKQLDKETTDEATGLGLDSLQCYLPPTYKRFGRRITDKKNGLGYVRDKSGWAGYGKFIGAQSNESLY